MNIIHSISNAVWIYTSTTWHQLSTQFNPSTNNFPRFSDRLKYRTRMTTDTLVSTWIQMTCPKSISKLRKIVHLSLLRPSQPIIISEDIYNYSITPFRTMLNLTFSSKTLTCKWLQTTLSSNSIRVLKPFIFKTYKCLHNT